MKSKSKQPSIRPKGQGLIPLSFIFRTANKSNDVVKEPETKKLNEKGSRISLSAFLNKKLQGSSVIPGSVQGKTKPFSSPVADQLVEKSNKDESGEKDKGEGDISASLSLAVVLSQFRKTECEVKDNICSRESQNSCLTTDEVGRSRKRKQGDVGSQAPRKVMAVLGEDAGAGRRAKGRPHGIEKKRPLYNHYSNGGGFWDCDMEGVDNEEIGCNDIWEGVGSTNLGGLGSN